MTAEPLSQLERTRLLEIARTAIRSQLEAGVGVAPAPGSAADLGASGALSAHRGVFVSLHVGRALRGCIGYIESALPVVRAVAECAVKAATEDPRFPPLVRPELGGVEIEISLLTKPQPTIADEITPGRHGVIIRHRGRTAVFLPQVATEQGWDREQLLSELCRKAGLPQEAWRDPGARLESFEADVFGDSRN